MIQSELSTQLQRTTAERAKITGKLTPCPDTVRDRCEGSMPKFFSNQLNLNQCLVIGFDRRIGQ